MQSGNKFKVLYVSAEVAPFAKTGGLADVAGSLPKALTSLGNDVRVVMPRYRTIRANMHYLADFPVQIGEQIETCIVREAEMSLDNTEGKNVPIYFIDNFNYYDREGVYCHFDDGDRFAFFCMAVLEMLPRINFQPDIIHCNDWHSGPICMLLNEKYKNHSFYSNIATVYTIHNLEYQGNFNKEVLRLFNIEKDIFTPEGVEFYNMFSFMKSGLVYANVINTVSQVYAKEIQTPGYGEKMDGILKKRKQNLFGIVNGISYEEFNPMTDKRIYKNYNADTLENKKENKIALQKEMGLPVRDVPVISLVTRLSGQKGLDHVIDSIDKLISKDIQLVLLGTGDEYYEDAFTNIRDRYPDKIGVFIGFNAVLAQRIYAGSDMFLMPSRFEPCGLGQLISLRYGTIPIVRETGGLAETIVDYDRDTKEGNGFSFKEFTTRDMLKAIDRALKLYNDMPEEWNRLVKKALSLDFSWNLSALKYIDIYLRALEKKVTYLYNV